MASLPQYMTGQNQFDTTPLENGLARYFQRQQWQQEQANKQRQLEFEAQRVGMDQQRLGLQVDLHPLHRQQMQQGIDNQKQEYDQRARTNPEEYNALVEKNRHTRAVNPYSEYGAWQDNRLKEKQIEGDPLQAFDPEKRYGFKDPKAPGGVRWLDMPDGGNGGPGQKKFNEKTGELAAERYGTIIKHGDAQPQSLFDLQRLEEISKVIGHPTAKVQIAAKYGPMLKAVGLEPKNMSDIELFSSLISKMAPNMRPPGSGATSDFDLQQYINSLPQIAQTPEGRAALIQHQRAVAGYSMAQADIAKRAALGQITRGQAEEMMAALPDPHMIWKKLTGTAPTVEITPQRQPPPQPSPQLAPPQPLDRTQVEIHPDSAKRLRENPTPEMQRLFDERYGPGAAKRELRMQ